MSSVVLEKRLLVLRYIHCSSQSLGTRRSSRRFHEEVAFPRIIVPRDQSLLVAFLPLPGLEFCGGEEEKNDKCDKLYLSMSNFIHRDVRIESPKRNDNDLF